MLILLRYDSVLHLGTQKYFLPGRVNLMREEMMSIVQKEIYLSYEDVIYESE